MTATVEVGTFGGRLSLHDPEGCRLELAGALEDFGALIGRLGLLPAPPAPGVSCPSEARMLAELADEARQAVAHAARRLGFAAFPEELIEVRAEIASERAAAAGRLGSTLAFPGR